MHNLKKQGHGGSSGCKAIYKGNQGIEQIEILTWWWNFIKSQEVTKVIRIHPRDHECI